MKTVPPVARLATRCLHDTAGDDLVEYAMLTALVAVVTIAAWGVIEGRLGQSYTTYDGKTQAIWSPDDPLS